MDKEVGGRIMLFAIIGLLFYGIFLIGRQIYNYLKLGMWEEYTVINLFKEWGFADKWVQAPKEWVGVWQLLDSFHAVFFLFFLMIVCIILQYVNVWLDEL